MEALTLRDLLEAVNGHLLGEFDDLDVTVTKVERDSRAITPGCLFLPLEGERFDGHAYIEQALEAGAAGCLTQRERERYLPGKFYIKVGSTHKALKDLALWYKARYNVPVVGVTGSVGKTTTRDMIAAVLGEKYRVLKTEGNYNNDIGLPLTVLRLGKEHQIAVLEMGMNHVGEMDYLSSIAQPDVVVITNIGEAHIENLGSREGIFQAKCEIFNHCKPDAFTVLSGDDDYLPTLRGQGRPTALCGRGEGLDYRAEDLTLDEKSRVTCRLTTPRGGFQVTIPTPGEHMIYPALMAAAVAEHFGLSQEQIADGIQNFTPTKMRMNILDRQGDITILDDGYNASPQSMRSAINVLDGYSGTRKIAVLGDMFELGAMAQVLHAGVGEYLARSGVDSLIAIGELAQNIYEAALSGVPDCVWCAEKEEALPALAQRLCPGATVLVKASRGMAFETITEYLKSITKEA